MKLIVLDRFLFPGGVETSKLNLLPEMAKRVELLVWVLPSYKIPYFQERLPAIPNLVFESSEWPYGNPQRYIDSLIRRLSVLLKDWPVLAACNNGLDYIAGLNLDRRLAYLAKKFQATHMLDASVFDAPMPHTDLILSGIIYDLNWRLNYPPPVVKRMQSILTDYLQNSDILFSISDFTKAQIAEFLPGNRTPVRTIQLGGNYIAPKATPHKRDGIVLYCPATVSPQKNHITLFKAAAELASRNVEFQLVLTGNLTELLISDKPTSNAHIELCRNFYWDNKVLWGRVQALGQCHYSTVEDLYATCRAVIFPSLYEGFGLPVLEGLWHQAPVICSSIAAIVEQLQFYDCLPAVTLFDPLDSRALAQCMEDALTGKLKVELSTDEIAQRLLKWTWSDAASAYVEQLKLYTKKGSQPTA